jgi:hypothetical protein
MAPRRKVEQVVEHPAWDGAAADPHADGAALHSKLAGQLSIAAQSSDDLTNGSRAILHTSKGEPFVPVVKAPLGAGTRKAKGHRLCRMPRTRRLATPPPPPKLEGTANFELRSRRMMAWRIDVLCWRRWGDQRAPLMEKFNISHKTAWTWRSGARTPHLHEVALLAREFGVTMDFLYLGSTIGLDDQTLAGLSAIGLLNPD